MILKIPGVFYLWITAASVAFGQPVSSLKKGDSAFAARQYRLALQHYQVVEKSGYQTPAMLLKMAYINEGLSQTAPGLRYLSLYYQLTGDVAAREKILSVAAKNQLNGYEPSDWERLRELAGKQKFLISIALGIIITLLAGWVVFQKNRHKRVTSVALAFLTAGALALAANQYGNQPVQYAVLNGSSNYLMLGPSAGAGLVSIQKDGHRVRIVGQKDIWLAIVWNDETVYIRQNQVLPLRAL